MLARRFGDAINRKQAALLGRLFFLGEEEGSAKRKYASSAVFLAV